MENHFNLIDSPWIPVSEVGPVSLKTIFSNAALRALGGSSVEKIAITKLLLAIAQAAHTPQDDGEWEKMGWQGMAENCLGYLKKWHDRFYLYGDKPFLQMPAIRTAERKSVWALSPEVSTGNTTVLTQTQQQHSTDDADRALAIIVQMGFGLSGKKTDNSVVLTPGYLGKQNDKGKPASGKHGVSVGHLGLLHSFWLGNSIIHTLWLNLFTTEDIAQLAMYPSLGVAPWENMPTGEDDKIARALKKSLLGRLVPMGKFCLLENDSIHYTDGVIHAGYLEGKVDPTASVDFSQIKPKALWANPNKTPWRELPSLLHFIGKDKKGGVETQQLKITFGRVSSNVEQFSLWSGGLRVSSNAGEQYASGTDDYVQSEIRLSSHLTGSEFINHLEDEMEQLDNVQKLLWGAVVKYFRQLSDIDKSGIGNVQVFVSSQAEKTTRLFWRLCEQHSQVLISTCASHSTAGKKRIQLRKTFVSYALQVFDQMCPNDSARQMDAWACTRPSFSEYLSAD
ncbi:type I-E CRISPR-associated protein Cse1/CasA [Pantoea sp. A4]|uniref:type I-E CRISPR-associated protein Cse1/CasA n=1 Tax=Pantoea sp. A4 TaxID=1225184 RepID=UPI00036F2E48|nr:type I-E CRISPR-associated protein Cse1/CasA [Pantoea sp. A4]